MKTIRLPYKTTEDLTPILKQYSNVVRYSYNRFLEGKTEKDIRLLSKSLNSIDLLNSWFIQCAIKDGKATHMKKTLFKIFVSIITSFTARIYGKRRSKRKTEQLIKELKSDD